MAAYNFSDNILLMGGEPVEGSTIQFEFPAFAGGQGGAGGLSLRNQTLGPQGLSEAAPNMTIVVGTPKPRRSGLLVTVAPSDEAALYKKYASFPSLEEFCTAYALSGEVKARLARDGFETIAGLLEVTREELLEPEVGFKEEEVEELGRALRAFLGTCGITAY
ncbi:hypothetical protein HMN09_00377400 [Mycena chlorophos]|uniref:Uncharacterized protein n=1 Tax=Mycena chlorophos TaxID=658473 RepID=A0A8H6TH71_MYCCL|nr:hypothetical protein HMN09_00377400 [Mycena chlorophos]